MQRYRTVESFDSATICGGRNNGLRQYICRAVIVGLAGLFCLLLPIGLRSAPTKTMAKSTAICVNPVGTNGCQASIQAAINAATNGDTINVAPGTYAEDLNVNKSVSILGANAAGTAGATILFGVDNNATATHIAISADNVTIDGLTIDDANSFGKSAPGANNQGIFIGNVSGAVIRRNVITNSFVDAPTGGTAVYLDANTKGAIIEQNTISNSGNGILFDASGSHDNFTIRKNLFTGNGRGSSSSRAAVRFVSAVSIAAGHKNVISFNSFVGNINGGGINNASGIATSAKNNWWGCNFGPGAIGAGCSAITNAVSANVDANPRLVLRLVPAVAHLAAFGEINVTASLQFNSENADTLAIGSLPDHTPISFNTLLGTVNPANVATTAGKAETIFTAGGTTGEANIAATADGQTVSITLSILCPTTNCSPVGPGISPNALSPPDGQQAGSVLFFNIFSSSTNTSAENTRIGLTNIEPSRTAYVHLFFVDGATGGVADSFVCLTPGQTTSFLASDLDPNLAGYIIAVAVDLQGCPINFNYLIGDEYVKLASGHAANLGAQAVMAVGNLPACNPATVTAILSFDGTQFSAMPRILALDHLPSRADGNDTLLILNRIGGILTAGTVAPGTLFGTLFDDTETGVSFNLAMNAGQFRAVLSNFTLRTNPRPDTLIPAGRSGWMKMWLDDGTSALTALTGVAINFNLNSRVNASAYNQGHNLHALGLTDTVKLTVPIAAPNC